MSTLWTDTSSFASVPAGTVVDADVLPFADVSQAAGSQQRVITIETLGAVLNGVVGVNSYAVPTTLDATTDRGHHVRVTAAAAVTIPPSLPIGWSCVIENATVSDTVSIAAGVGVTILSAGDNVANGKWVAIVMVNTNVASVVGSFADEVVGGDVVGPASAVDSNFAAFDGVTGKLIKDALVSTASFATAAQGTLADSAVQPADPISVNAQTGTTYTLVLADAGKLVTLSNAGAITLTVPLNSSVALPVGTVIACAQLGAGLVSVEGAAGVTINGVDPGAEASAGQWSTWSLTKLATDTWLASGGIA